MILGGHAIISAYGFWLPNDPRGSWSDFVRSWELFRYGAATKVNTRESVAHAEHNAALRAAAKSALRYPPVVMSGRQALCVGQGFGRIVKTTGRVVHACAILPDHVHLVIRRHRYAMEQVLNLLKGGATRELTGQGPHPLKTHADCNGKPPCPWARRFWLVYIDDHEHLGRAIRYVEDNPLKEGKHRQRWSLVSPYEGR